METKNILVWLLAFSLAGTPACSQTYDGALKSGSNDLSLSMPDGIKLSTKVFIPKGKGPFPTVLVRTPYGIHAEQWMGKSFNLFKIAVVIQDVRGKYGSEGEFYPFVNERPDGLRTLQWIREQSWSDGTVAGWGGSYVGYTQWAISDSLDFCTLLLTGANLYEFVYPDNLFSLQTAYIWGTENASQNSNKIPKEKQQAGILTLPVSAADDSAIVDIGYYNDWIRHAQYDEYWKTLNYRGMAKGPVLSMAGWYDIFLMTQLHDFDALPAKNDPLSRLVIGPWCHGKQGEVNEYGGLKRTGKPTAIFGYVKNYLKGNRARLKSPLHNSKYNLFIMERNEYVASDSWPPRETTVTPWYLGPDGYLGASPAESDGIAGYTYSPADPFPSLGGTALGDGVGPARQNDNVSRPDQAVFQTAIGDQPLILLGEITATLWLESTADTTAFMVCLQDVFPDGKIINIQEGGATVTLSSGAPEKKSISVWATGYQLNPGHKLRVVITSSWFPRFNRCLNTGEPAFTATQTRIAEQKIHFGKGTPSAINLPVYHLNNR